jgi:glyoxylase I family protein
MPKHVGFSHVSLSVRDLDTSTTWYGDVLGFSIIDKVEHTVYREHVMVHPSGAILCLQNHHANAGESFSPERTGMDHIGFRVMERAELDEWTAVFADKGITHSPIVDAEYGSVLCFRDPDGVQLEMFYRENHP